jgi:hypothetical protein
MRPAMPFCRKRRRVLVQRCVVAAELEYGAAKPPRDRFGYVAADARGSRKAEQRHSAVRQHRFADLGVGPDHQVEDAIKTMPVKYALADLMYGNSGQWRFGRRFPDHAIAADRRNHGVP